MKKRHLRSYHALIEIGFSAHTALAIIIDAQRGNRSALMFARIAIRAKRI